MLKNLSRKKLLAVMTTVCMLVTLLAVAGSAIIMANNTTYYVDSVSGNDSNNGTSTGSAWRTLSKVNSTTFQPGDRILFKAGCSWSGCLKPQGSGSSGSPITIDMYGIGNKPLITGGPSGESTSYGPIYAGAYFKNQEYIEIYNLEITCNYASSPDYERSGIWFYDQNGGIKHGIKISNCYIHDVNSRYFDNASRVMAAIQFNVLGSGTGFDGVTIENNTIEYCYNSAGIYVATYNLSTRDDNTGWIDARTNNKNYTVRNNTVTYVGLDGIQVGYCNNALIESNIVKYASNYDESALPNAWTLNIWTVYSDYVTVQYNSSCYALSGGDAEGYDIDKYVRYSNYQYNYSRGNKYGAILDMNLNDSGNTFRYNISQNEVNCVFRMGQNGTSYDNFYNNTVYIGSGSPQIFGTDPSVPYAGNTPGSFYNNIIYNNGSATWGYWFTTNNDYNCFYGNGVGSWPLGSNTIISNPNLVNPGSGGETWNSVGGYMLQSGSPCINAGKTISGNGGKDYWGNTVPYGGGNTDIGAHEYQGGGATPTPTPSGYTMVNDDAAGVSYSGTWYDDNNRPSEYNGDLHYTATNGNYVQYTFTGTGVDWINEKANDMGNVKVYIDGNLDAIVSIYNSTKVHQQTVYSKSGLTSGAYTIKLEKQDGSYMSFDALKIYSGGGATPTPTPTPTPSNLLTNPGFEQDGAPVQSPTGWTTWSPTGDSDADFTESGDPYSGTYNCKHYKTFSYKVCTYQIKSISNGVYTVRTRAKSSGGQNQAYMYVKSYGGSELQVNIPVSSTYQLITVSNINATSGTIEIGFWSDATANNWIQFDNVELSRQ